MSWVGMHAVMRIDSFILNGWALYLPRSRRYFAVTFAVDSCMVSCGIFAYDTPFAAVFCGRFLGDGMSIAEKEAGGFSD